MIGILFVIAVALHGLGHALFVGNAWGYWQTAGEHSSLLGSLSGPVESALGALWLVPLAGFLLGTWALVGHGPTATPLLVGSAVISSVMIVLWWGTLTTGSAFFALVFNLLVIAVLLWRPDVVGAART